MKISSFLTSKGCTVAVLLFINFCTVSSNVCVPLFDSCNDDCDCCGHDFNKNIRCELRNQGLGKRCYETLYIGQPCSVNSQCVSQNCVNNICRPNFGPRVNNPFCPLDDGPDDIVGPVDGSLPTCACPQGPTQDATFVLDRDLSTDYVNYNSQDFSGFIVEPTFNYPLRKMEVCSSSANPENDPMCYRIEGKCKNDNGFTLLKEGGIPFGNTRRNCVTVPVNGRQSYTDYRIGFGCRRGGYNNDCTCQAKCDEIPPGQIPGCTSCNEEDANAFNPLSLVPTYPQYDITTDTTKFLYSFENNPDHPDGRKSKSKKGKKTSAPTASKSKKTSAPTASKYSKKQRMLGHSGWPYNPSCTHPPLLHPVIQWQGKCCFDTSGFKVFASQNSNEQFTTTVSLNSPDHTTGMKGVIFDGPYDFDGIYFFQIVVKGKFTETALVDYALSGEPGTSVRYGKVQGPKCDCESQGSSRLSSLFKKARKLANTCTDYPVILSEVKLMGRCNEGSRRDITT